jgi:UDP-glucuronate decarboxylase
LLVGLFPEKKLGVERRFQTEGTAYIPSAYNRLIPNVERLEGLGWKAQVGPAEGFKRMIEAHQS